MDIHVKVIPKSSKTELVGPLPDGTWKERIAAAPERARPIKIKNLRSADCVIGGFRYASQGQSGRVAVARIVR